MKSFRNHFKKEKHLKNKSYIKEQEIPESSNKRILYNYIAANLYIAKYSDIKNIIEKKEYFPSTELFTYGRYMMAVPKELQYNIFCFYHKAVFGYNVIFFYNIES